VGGQRSTPTRERPYKVAVWATGGVGRYAIRTIANRPTFEVAGAWVHSRHKDGQDVGTLAGIEPLGVTATRDKDALLSGDIDCVMYAGPAGSRPKEALEDFCQILSAGKNLVTTSLPGLVYERGSLSDRYLDPIREATRAGSSSMFSSGIEPGFGCDLFPIALMTMSHSVYSVRGIEISNYSQYPVEFDMRELFGFGQPLDYQGGLKAPGVLRWGWGAAVTMVADALGVELDEIREACEFQPTPRRLETACGVIESGTVGAIWAKCIGVVDGQEVIAIEHVDRMADDLAPDWPVSRSGGTDGYLARNDRRGAQFRRRVRGRVSKRAKTPRPGPAGDGHARGQRDSVGLRCRTRNRRRFAHAVDVAVGRYVRAATASARSDD
jgi:hypothetical protein